MQERNNRRYTLYTVKGKNLFLKFKINSVLDRFVSYSFNGLVYSLLSLIIAIAAHELGHYFTAYYYNLNPGFGISKSGIFISASSSTRYIEEIVANSGVLANLLLVFIFIIVLFLRESRCKKHHFSCYFSLLVIVANLLIAIISLILFPFVLNL